MHRLAPGWTRNHTLTQKITSTLGKWRGLLIFIAALALISTIIFAINQRVSADTSTPISISSFNTAVPQNFDTLASTGTSSTTPAGWGFAESGTNANTTYTAGTGSSTAGDTYSFGTTSDRAFGGLQSGTLVPTVGAVFVNNTGGAINSLIISYTGEQWRLGATGRLDRLDFQYSTNATSLTSGTYNDINALDFTAPVTTGSVGALDGNASPNRTFITSTISGLSIPNGATFWIRWASFDASGADDGLAIDDFSISATGGGDAAPSVSTTVPAAGSTNVAANSNVAITFSEPVNVTGNWFQIACNTSGTRQVADTTVTGGPTTFTIDPNSDFAPNEQCTVTVFAAQVSDQDANDPPDNMAANALFSFTAAGPPAEPRSVVVSQVYGGGGNSGATIKNDFIELINHTGSSINLSGWSVQYAGATASSWSVTPLTGTLAPGQYLLIQEAAGAGGTVNLTPDVIGSIAMGATAGKVALVNSTSALTDACPSDPSIIDFVGYGTTASCFEGSGPTSAPSNTTAVLRATNGCTDTDDNANDFDTGTPNPRNSSSPSNNCAVFGGVGSANPASVQPGDTSTLTVNVTPGSNPTSTGISVVADLSAIGGSASQPFSGIGNSFTHLATVAVGTTPGQKSLPVTITDAQARTANTTINITVLQPPPNADHVVISQIYGGGGNSNATYKNDFVELFNPGSSAFDLTGWSIQYSAFNGSGWGSNKQPLGGSIGAGEYYLVKLAAGTEGADLPAANVEGVINLSGSTGKVALVSSFQPLTGNCPLADPNLVDFVGYGSTAATSGFCYEGPAPAPGPAGNNTVSVLRKGAGATDTNNNSNDLQIGAVNPRRTAPIVELGPNVLTTDPASNGFNVPHDASITVSFTEPVDVVGAWYNIACADLTTHNDATVVVSNNFKTYVITPNVNFGFGQQCTVTINKDNVHDQDTDDSGPNTDTPPSDYSWTFSVVAAGDPAPYPPSVHLTMGNPSNAVVDTNQFNNYLMAKPTYSLSYNRDKGTPNWVSWHLEPAWFGNLTRIDTFRPDPAVPPDWYRVQATDYSGSGFDRGHMTPNADRDNENRIPINQETYLMSNMVPQAPDNNQGPWAAFENYLRSIVTSPQNNELYIVSGPLGVGGSGSNGGTTNNLAGGHVTVPQYTWKVVLVIPIGDNDLSRVTAATRTIAILMPNTQGIRNDPWENYLTTVDHVEELTGYNFFSNVPDAIQNAIEAGTNGTNPPGTSGQAVTTAEDNSTNITLTAVSPGGPLTYSIVTPPAHGQLTGSDANRNYEPDPNYNGPDNFTFKVNDGSNDSNTSTVSITVSEVNDPPTANDDNAGSTDEDLALNISAADLTVNDQTGPANESVQTLTVTGVSSTADTHGSVSLDNGTITYTPATNYNGPASFSYQVCDNGTTNGSSDSQCASATVSLIVSPVNDNPVAVDDSATTDEDTPVTIDVVANDTDVDGDTRTLQNVGTASHGSVTIVAGKAQYSPASNFNGSDNFTYVVSDGHGGTATGNVSITINAVNDNPVAVDDSATTDEDTPVNIDVVANDTDVDGDTRTLQSVGTASHGSVTIVGGQAHYSPAADFNGSDSFTYVVSDGHGGTASGNVNITVNPVNDNPVAVDDSATTDEDTPVTVNVIANDTDVDGDSRTLQSVGTASHGSVTIVGGQAQYSPAADFNGSDSFTYVVSDGHGGTATGNVSVTINPVNDNPVAVNDSATTDEDTPVNIDVVANDTDVDGDTRTLQSVGTASHGSVTIVGGQAHYSPNANFNGSDSFTYVVSDGHGGTATGTVNVTINPVNDNPVAVDDSAATDEDTPVRVNVVGNDTDVDGDTRTLQSVGTASHGSVAIVSGQAQYSPATNFNGSDSFTYVVSDGHGGTATGNVNITVNPVNDAPVLSGVPATASVVYGTNLTFQASASDVDLPAQTLTFSLSGQPAGASINPSTGVFSWTPTAVQADANYTFSVRVSDGQATTSSSITVTVQLKPVTSLGPAQLWLGVNKGGDVGTKFDLLAEVFRNGVQLIGSGELDDADVGAVNFNTALLQSITISQVGPSGLRTGDTLSIRLSARIANSSANKNGTARLWYNDAAANSNFAATIGGVANNYFLRTGSVLTIAPGAGPRSNIDVTVKRTGGNPWVPFGTWSITY